MSRQLYVDLFLILPPLLSVAMIARLFFASVL